MINSILWGRIQKRTLEDTSNECLPYIKKRMRPYELGVPPEDVTAATVLTCNGPTLSPFTSNKVIELPKSESVEITNELVKNAALTDTRNAVPIVRDELNNQLTELEYVPDPGATENPYYDKYNRLLFELHVERVERSTVRSTNSSQSFL